MIKSYFSQWNYLFYCYIQFVTSER